MSLTVDRRGARVVAGPGRGLDELGPVVVAAVLGLRGAQAGAGHLEVAQLRHRRPQDAGEAGRAAADHRAGDPALLVGVRAERDVDGLAGDPVEGLGAVARSEDLGVRAAALGVRDVDRARRRRAPGRPPGRVSSPGPCPGRGRRGRRRSCPRRCARRDGAVGSTSISRTGWFVCTSMPLAHGGADALPHVVVELRHRQGVGEDDGHLEPAGLQHLGHLEPDVAAPEDDGPLRPGRDGRPDVGAVGQAVHAVHAVGVEPAIGGRSGLPRWPPRASRSRGARRRRPRPRRPPGRCPRRGCRADGDVLRGEVARRPRQQLVAVLDEVPIQ